jgi:hypothetical protein
LNAELYKLIPLTAIGKTSVEEIVPEILLVLNVVPSNARFGLKAVVPVFDWKGI